VKKTYFYDVLGVISDRFLSKNKVFFEFFMLKIVKKLHKNKPFIGNLPFI